MIIVSQLKITPTIEQAERLANTINSFVFSLNYISSIANDTGYKTPSSLQPLVYKSVKENFHLGAQAACLAVRVVCSAYKKSKTKPKFRKSGAVVYDVRNLSINTVAKTVSIWTTGGREKIPYQAGERQQGLLTLGVWKQADLVCRNNSYYLLVSVEIPDANKLVPVDYLGVDFGIINITADSDGNLYSGSKVINVRHRHRRLRRNLQKKGTKSAKRRLKKLSGKERRFATWVNHNISKKIVRSASGTGRGIVLENLRGIRERITARKRQRTMLHSWSFFQLRSFITYKAALLGVPVEFINPAYTSQTCPACGFRDKKNRPKQSTFRCILCGHTGKADLIAAENIRRAVVNQPNVSARGLQTPRL